MACFPVERGIRGVERAAGIALPPGQMPCQDIETVTIRTLRPLCLPFTADSETAVAVSRRPQSPQPPTNPGGYLYSLLIFKLEFLY